MTDDQLEEAVSFWRSFAPTSQAHAIEDVVMPAPTLADYVDPVKRRLPVVSQSDANQAARLVCFSANPQKAAARLMRIVRRRGLQIPESMARVKIQFSPGQQKTVNFSAGGNYKFTGKIFQVGDYPDKNFSLNQDEAILAARRFNNPVEIDLEHMPSILDGKLGRLTKVWNTPDGRELWGETEIPKWLLDLVPPEKRKLSASFDRNSKSIVGLSLVVDPRVTDAALMTAAFSAGVVNMADPMVNPDGTMGDPAAAGGTEAPADASGATMHGSDLFDHIAELIADALAEAKDNPMYSADYAKSLESIQKVCEENSKSAPEEGAAEMSGKKKAAKFSDSDPLSSGSKGKAAADSGDDPRNPANAADTVKDQTSYAQMSKDDKAKFSTLESQVADLRRKNWNAEAQLWARNEITLHRASSHEFDGLVDSFVSACEDDQKVGGTVNFNKQQVTRLEAVKRKQAARPALSHLDPKEMVPSGGGTANFNSGVDQNRVQELLGKTALGRSAMTSKN